ncbi:MAG TPA: L,D-transpeptidase [Allosphingosinicella sp.]|nr:L,D-transpeptidase [Allosphingosinicella sp.]
MKLLKVAAALMLVASPIALSAKDMVSLTMPKEAPSDIFSGSRSRDALVAQVLLDHSRHSPGVIDGIMGGNTARAIKSFQRANGMPVTGKISSELLRKLVADYSGDIVHRYTITSEDVDGPFVNVPSSMEEKAKLDKLAYESPAEALAEKFHMDQSFLKALNPGVDFGKAGTKITVVKAGDEQIGADVARIEVDKKASAVRAYASDGKLLATYPATVGSSTFPSPSGKMQVKAVAPAPKYYFSPEGRKWGPDKKLTIAAGPNNPVGSTWIDLSKEGYGIHGSPDPKLIGKTASHGCVRLANWDAAELGKAVSQGTTVEFV